MLVGSRDDDGATPNQFILRGQAFEEQTKLVTRLTDVDTFVEALDSRNIYLSGLIITHDFDAIHSLHVATFELSCRDNLIGVAKSVNMLNSKLFRQNRDKRLTEIICQIPWFHELVF